MSIWTKEELLTQIADWKAALTAAATGQSYTIDGATLTRYDLPKIREHLAYLDSQLAQLSGKPSGPVFVHGRVRR